MSEKFEAVDTNKWLIAPPGYEVHSVQVEGNYLKVRYTQEVFQTATTQVIAVRFVDIFLNSDGREVMRTMGFNKVPTAEWGKTITEKVSWWEKVLLYIEVYVFRRF